MIRSQDLTNEANEVVKCYHCGNDTLMPRVGRYNWGSKDTEYTDFDFSYTYEMFACPVCHKITIRQTYSDETMLEYGGQDQMWYGEQQAIIFPVSNIENDSIPDKVKRAYESSLKVKNIDVNACLIMLRRTLETILVDKGATKWGLKGKIEEIAQKGLLPDTLKEVSSLTKLLGDSAAHDKEIEIEIDQYDVENMAEFVGFIIEYLYVIPGKISTYKELLSSTSTSDNIK